MHIAHVHAGGGTEAEAGGDDTWLVEDAECMIKQLLEYAPGKERLVSCKVVAR